jgi:hypothetical protein
LEDFPQQVTALLDTGAENISLIRVDLLPSSSCFFTKHSCVINGINRATTSPGFFMLQFHFPTVASSRIALGKFYIVPNLQTDMILGTDIITLLGLIINLKQATLSWDGHEGPLTPPNGDDEDTHRVAAILDAHYAPSSVEQILDKLEPVQLAALSASLAKVIQQWPVLFSAQLHHYTGPPAHLELTSDAKPYYSRPYQIPVAYQDVTKRELERLEELDVITKAPPSAWGAPCFVIPKKNKQVRLVTDYRRANNYLVRRPYQSPRIDSLLNRIAAAKPTVFSALDIMMGYHTIRLDDASQEVTTFTMPWGA